MCRVDVGGDDPREGAILGVDIGCEGVIYRYIS